MKRVYTKPALVKECFEVESQIALTCAVITNNASLVLQCNYEPDGLGFFIFGEGWSSCIDGQYKDGSGSYCYHAGANNLFQS